jgi:hypothetical protein
VYAVPLPHPNLPRATLVIETSARVFQRTVRIGVERAPDRHRRDAWFEVRAAHTWRHDDEQTPARPLAVQLEPMPDTELRLVIDEGDNAPLPITAARLLLPSYRLRFFHPENATLRFVYGRDDLQSPQYDLALLAPRVMGAVAQEVGAAAPSTAPRREPEVLISRRMFWVLLSGAVIVLLALIARLVRSQEHQPSA